MRSVTGWMERHQVALYLSALAAAAIIGLAAPQAALPAGSAIIPVLSLLLYVTFLGVPFAQIGAATRDWPVLCALVALNFLVVPVVVFVLSRLLTTQPVLLIGVVLVLLAPCTDYVIVFSGLAGGASDRLLAATPLLMILQMVLVPVYVSLIVGPDLLATIDAGPFIEAFVLLIIVPVVAAAITQFAASRVSQAKAISDGLSTLMVPLMMLTLALVVVSQIGGISHQLRSLIIVVPIFFIFAAVMVPLGIAAGRIARLDQSASRAVVFSGATRNSLVVLPLALALPAAYSLAPLVVVTQTLVELIVMVVFVRLIPKLI